jgi:hypothetical protein
MDIFNENIYLYEFCKKRNAGLGLWLGGKVYARAEIQTKIQCSIIHSSSRINGDNAFSKTP